MAKVSLSTLTTYCDQLLQTKEFKDWEGAVNGLQVENRGNVSRIAAAVDATIPTIRMAIEAGADLLIVHHGLFWSPSHPWTGRRYEMLRLLLDHDLAVYSSHLPLDAHPKLGNNALLCRAIGLKTLKPFFHEKERYLGFQAAANISREDLARRLGSVLGKAPVVVPGGPAVCKKIGVATGGAGTQVKQAAREGVDTFITGEGAHWTYGLAEDLGVNLLYGGHYATETFGVKALAAHLSAKYRVPWEFLDRPTGL